MVDMIVLTGSFTLIHNFLVRSENRGGEKI